MSGKTALVAGASGLIGSELLNILVNSDEYEKVIAIVRSPLSFHHPKLQVEVINFNELEKLKTLFAVNDVYCCLGTTIKKAKTQDAMYKIDVEYPLEIAKLSQQMGAKQLLLVSALGANPHSNVFYSRMKGELEKKIENIPFHSVSIFQPSLLLGDRKEFRFGEKMGIILSKVLSFMFVGPLRKYKAIEAKSVALAMYKVAQLNKRGYTIYPSEKIASIVND